MAGSFSPDGNYLVDSSNSASQSRVRVYAVRKTGAVLSYVPPRDLFRLPGIQYAPAISPDGRWITFSYALAVGKVVVAPFRPDETISGEPVQVSADEGRSPRWSRNGELFYQDRRQIWVVPWTIKDSRFVPGKPRLFSAQLLSESEDSVFDVASDGKRVLAIIDAAQPKPEIHLRVLVNVALETERRRAVGPQP